jgi:hypothetical protein
MNRARRTDRIVDFTEAARFQQEIRCKCTWSDTHDSLKTILKQTANQLPLLIAFNDTDRWQTTNRKTYRTVLFFDTNISKKLLLTPLKQHHDESVRFEPYPKNCTLLITDQFKGKLSFNTLESFVVK